jgi:hypothetical protein
VYEASSGLYLNTDDLPLYYVYAETQEYVEEAAFLYLTCSTEKGRVACTAVSGADTFFHCPVVGPPDALIFGTVEGGKASADCVKLGVTPVCD